ncbi:unnamed protein product [Fraxinus pennsylvanica]|uniref:Uncharacterized protein n=1 Tax=Fraxinus pennsylvanica TaxID=56036 RepID=A0AAD1ZXT0_9LAMI|nr:unnamed protein product [Fraxinus pennsylvanica]
MLCTSTFALGTEASYWTTSVSSTPRNYIGCYAYHRHSSDTHRGDVCRNGMKKTAPAVEVKYHAPMLTKKIFEIKVNTISPWGSLEKERIFSCYSQLREIGMLESKTPNSLITPNMLSTLLSSTGVLESSSLSTAGSKRTLTYPDCDQDCPVQKIPRLC